MLKKKKDLEHNNIFCQILNIEAFFYLLTLHYKLTPIPFFLIHGDGHRNTDEQSMMMNPTTTKEK